MFTLPFMKTSGVPANGDSKVRPIIDLQDVNKSYKTAVGDYPALKNIDLQINAGEFVSIIGKSGSGKSTLLSLLGLLDRPTAGGYWLEDVEVSSLSRNALADIRNREGFAEVR